MAALESYPELRALGRLTQADRLDVLFAAYEGPQSRWYVAQAHESRLGALWVNLGHHPILERKEALIIAVGVVESARRQGIAHALLTHARHELEAEAGSWRLFVHPDNAPARRLYERHGFQPTSLEYTRL